MIYGLYLSATGVLTNSYRQDVIANNLANAETVGFKRSLAVMQQRRTEAQQLNKPGLGKAVLDGMSGGTLLSPTHIDQSAGVLERTDNNLDVAIHGRGFFAVHDGSETRLTRNGRFMLDRDGYLILADSTGHRVLGADGNEMQFQNVPQSLIEIQPDGSVAIDGLITAKVGLFDAPDESQIHQLGGNLLSYPNAGGLGAADGSLQAGFVENSNVDPTRELVLLIKTQRQLEANANMLRFQDQTLAKAVNEVGKIG